MRIARHQIDTLVAHARAEYPHECCGLIGSRDRHIEAIFPAVNAAASPLRYAIDPDELLRIHVSIDQHGLVPGGVYHSHPRGTAYPSQTDIELALHPDALHVIISLADPDNAQLRAFHIRDRAVVEVALNTDP